MQGESLYTLSFGLHSVGDELFYNNVNVHLDSNSGAYGSCCNRHHFNRRQSVHGNVG